MQHNQFPVQIERIGSLWAWSVVDSEGRALRSGRADSPQDAQRAAIAGCEQPVRLRALRH